MAAYLIVEALVNDIGGLAEYQQVVPKLVTQFGGEYIAVGGEHESLEGDWGATRIVMHRWPDMQTARDFWNSPEYQDAKLLRANTGKYRVILVDGLKKELLEEE